MRQGGNYKREEVGDKIYLKTFVSWLIYAGAPEILRNGRRATAWINIYKLISLHEKNKRGTTLYFYRGKVSGAVCNWGPEPPTSISDCKRNCLQKGRGKR